jgi:LacI family transcriptional regulator
VTQGDVARAAGVNRATVSRALDPARRHLINAHTVARIEQVATQLGYRPNALARGLKIRRSGLVALVIKAELTPFAEATLVRAIGDALAQSGRFAIVVHDLDSARAEPHPILHLARGLIDGAIVVTAEGSPPGLVKTPVPVPIVTVGFAPAQRANVVLDEATGVAIAVRHLARLGHRRIAFICEPAGTARGDVFLETYRQTCRELFGSVDEELIESFHPAQPASGRDACRALFHRGANPEAIAATEDGAAMACYGAVRHFGVTVGREISVVGMGNTPPTPFVEPPLTTIALPLDAAGAAAAELLLRQIDKDLPGLARTRPRVFEPYLVHRASSVTPPRPEAERGMRNAGASADEVRPMVARQ